MSQDLTEQSSGSPKPGEKDNRNPGYEEQKSQIASFVNAIITVAKEENAKEKKRLWFQKFKWIEAIGVVLVVIQTAIFIQQCKISADPTTDRPYILVDNAHHHIKVGDKIGISITFKNFGNTPAVDVETVSCMFIRTNPRDTLPECGTDSVLTTPTPVGSGGTYHSTLIRDDGPINLADSLGIAKGEFVPFVYGTVSYSKYTDRNYGGLEYCFYYNAKLNNFSACETGNRVW